MTTLSSTSSVKTLAKELDLRPSLISPPKKYVGVLTLPGKHPLSRVFHIPTPLGETISSATVIHSLLTEAMEVNLAHGEATLATLDYLIENKIDEETKSFSLTSEELRYKTMATAKKPGQTPWQHPPKGTLLQIFEGNPPQEDTDPVTLMANLKETKRSIVSALAEEQTKLEAAQARQAVLNEKLETIEASIKANE